MPFNFDMLWNWCSSLLNVIVSCFDTDVILWFKSYCFLDPLGFSVKSSHIHSYVKHRKPVYTKTYSFTDPLTLCGLDMNQLKNKDCQTDLYETLYCKIQQHIRST